MWTYGTIVGCGGCWAGYCEPCVIVSRPLPCAWGCVPCPSGARVAEDMFWYGENRCKGFDSILSFSLQSVCISEEGGCWNRVPTYSRVCRDDFAKNPFGRETVTGKGPLADYLRAPTTEYHGSTRRQDLLRRGSALTIPGRRIICGEEYNRSEGVQVKCASRTNERGMRWVLHLINRPSPRGTVTMEGYSVAFESGKHMRQQQQWQPKVNPKSGVC